MRKPDSLRAFLLANILELKDSPERLSLFAEAGQIVCTGNRTMSFEYRYSLKVTLQDFAGDADHVVIPVLAWIARHQSDLLNPGDKPPITFDAEILDADCTDLELSIELTEPAIVTAGDAGYSVNHPDEPADDDSFGLGVWQLFFRDQFLGETTDPGFPGNL
jgi:hypothetical protein